LVDDASFANGSSPARAFTFHTGGPTVKRILVLLAAMTLLGFDHAYAHHRPDHDPPGHRRGNVDVDVKQKVDVDVQQGQGQSQRSDVYNVQVVETPRDFLDAPWFMWLPDAVQPYKPDGWISSPGRFVPTRLTFEEAARCRRSGISDSWDGTSPAIITAKREDRVIELMYPQLQKDTSVPTGRFLGTAKARDDDDPAFTTVVCEAAYRAMEEGVEIGEVTFAIRGVSTYKGFSIGPSIAASVIPSAASQNSPYGVAPAIGGGTGFSSTRVEGELIVHITGFAKPFTPVSVPAPAKK
jgi:hypothetical protein